MSSDGGRNWTNLVMINQAPGDIPLVNQQAFMPQVKVAADGTAG